MDELISRLAVIQIIEKMRARIGHNLERSVGRAMIEILDEVGEDVEKLPSTQPEIIRCKDCKHFVREDVEEYTPYGYNTHFYAFCDKHWDEEQGEYIGVTFDDFCSFAERREDG